MLCTKKVLFTESDYLTWYNNEITRYRNLEWRIASYSIAVSWASAIFADRVPDNFLLPLGYFVFLFVFLLAFSEWHVHKSLTEYRAKLKKLEAGEGPEKHRYAEGVCWGEKGIDQIYFFAFLFLPVLVGFFVFKNILEINSMAIENFDINTSIASMEETLEEIKLELEKLGEKLGDE